MPQNKPSPAETLEAIRVLLAEVEEAGWEHDDHDHPSRAEKLARAQEAFAALQVVMADADDTAEGC